MRSECRSKSIFLKMAHSAIENNTSPVERVRAFYRAFLCSILEFFPIIKRHILIRKVKVLKMSSFKNPGRNQYTAEMESAQNAQFEKSRKEVRDSESSLNSPREWGGNMTTRTGSETGQTPPCSRCRYAGRVDQSLVKIDHGLTTPMVKVSLSILFYIVLYRTLSCRK